MAPQPKPAPSKLGSRLGAKVGPLPVWGWAALILGAYLLYTRLHPNTTSSETATPDTSGGSAADSTVSGQGGAADNMSQSMFDSLSANTSSLDALTSQLLSTPVGSGFGPTDPVPGDTGTVSHPGEAAAPSPAATASPTPTGAAPPASTGAPPAAHPTQTAAGKLSWGGLTFTTRAAFDSWAKAHGSSTTAELRNHPQARAIYSTLK